MSNGLLGKALSVADQPVTVATISSNAIFATVTVHVLNMEPEDALVHIAMTTNAAATAVDFVEHNVVVPANGGSIDVTCVLAAANEHIIVTSNKDNNAIRVTGLEQIPVPAV